MRKIALISEHASPLAPVGSGEIGSHNVYVAEVARQVALGDYQIDIFTRRDRDRMPAMTALQANVRVIHVPVGPTRCVSGERLLAMTPAFSEWIGNFFARERDGYDLVHASGYTSGEAGLAVARPLHIPLVMSFHEFGKLCRRQCVETSGYLSTREAIEMRLVQQADHLMAFSPQGRENLLHLYDADPDKISVVPCGFDAAEMKPVPKLEARRLLGWKPDDFTMFQLGRIAETQGYENAIRSVHRLEQQHGIPARLYIAGGPDVLPNEQSSPELLRLRGIAEALGVSERVVFLGRRSREELKYYYSAADVMVAVPRYEPAGIATIEAMACATPVIASAVGGLRSIVLDRMTGLLVPPDDVDALAAALAWLHENVELRMQYGERGRHRAIRHFTWRETAQVVTGIYETAMGFNPEEWSSRGPLRSALAMAVGAR